MKEDWMLSLASEALRIQVKVPTPMTQTTLTITLVMKKSWNITFKFHWPYVKNMYKLLNIQLHLIADSDREPKNWWTQMEGTGLQTITMASPI